MSRSLRIGTRSFDVEHRALVMGILNRTRDSFYDGRTHFQLDALLRRAEQLVADGADILEVGAHPGGVGVAPVPVEEEVERAASAIEALRVRFDVALGVDTWRAPVATAAFAAGAGVANDISGFSDSAYLATVATAGASVVATHNRLGPGVFDPEPQYHDLIVDVADSLRQLVQRARQAGLDADRIMVDPGLDLGKTWRQSLTLLARCAEFAAIGPVLLIAPSNKIFLGELLGLAADRRRDATIAACAVAISRGARVLRVHDAAGVRQLADLYAAVLAEDGINSNDGVTFQRQPERPGPRAGGDGG